MRKSTLTACTALLAVFANATLASETGIASSDASGSNIVASNAAHTAAFDQKTLKPFPAAKAGQTRWVIQLPRKAKEANWRVELMPGKHMQMDCNHRSLDGQLQTRTVQGWGYDYYEFSSQGQVISTLMGCPAGTTRPGFVHAQSLTLSYNSRLPIVVFTDKAYQLRYRIWQAQPVRSAQPR